MDLWGTIDSRWSAANAAHHCESAIRAGQHILSPLARLSGKSWMVAGSPDAGGCGERGLILSAVGKENGLHIGRVGLSLLPLPVFFPKPHNRQTTAYYFHKGEIISPHFFTHPMPVSSQALSPQGGQTPITGLPHITNNHSRSNSKGVIPWSSNVVGCCGYVRGCLASPHKR